MSGLENTNLEPEQLVDIFTFMKAKGFKPAGQGATGRFAKSPGGRGQGAVGQREVPLRGRTDMSCINCGRKGHAASE